VCAFIHLVLMRTQRTRAFLPRSNKTVTPSFKKVSINKGPRATPVVKEPAKDVEKKKKKKKVEKIQIPNDWNGDVAVAARQKKQQKERERQRRVKLAGQTSEALRIQILRYQVLMELHKTVNMDDPISFTFSYELKPQLLRCLGVEGSDEAYATFKWNCAVCFSLDAQLESVQRLMTREKEYLMVNSTITALLHMMTTYRNLIWSHTWEECLDMIDPKIAGPESFLTECFEHSSSVNGKEAAVVDEEDDEETEDDNDSDTIHLFFG